MRAGPRMVEAGDESLHCMPGIETITAPHIPFPARPQGRSPVLLFFTSEVSFPGVKRLVSFPGVLYEGNLQTVFASWFSANVGKKAPNPVEAGSRKRVG